MFEYFVRIEIRESADEAGESDQKRKEALASIQQWIDDNPHFMNALSSSNLTRGELTNTNGIDLLIAFGSRSKESQMVAKIRDLLSLIARVAPGSFGFAYYLNEDHLYSWKVLVLKRGQITEEEDPFFSPMIPTVED